jgi:hypothetical protein
MAAILALQEVQGTRELLELLVRRVRRVRLELLEQQAPLALEGILQAEGPHLEAAQEINHKPPTLHLVVATRRCFRLDLILVPMLELRLPPLLRMSSS